MPLSRFPEYAAHQRHNQSSAKGKDRGDQKGRHEVYWALRGWFQAPGGESAGNSLQALTHQPQGLSLFSLSASPPPQASARFWRKWGWGGVSHDPEAGSAEPRIISGGHRKRQERKEKLGFHFLKLPFLSCKNPKTTRLSLAAQNKQRAAPPSLYRNRRETGPGWQGQLMAYLWPMPTQSPATPNQLYLQSSVGNTAPWTLARALCCRALGKLSLSGFVTLCKVGIISSTVCKNS